MSFQRISLFFILIVFCFSSPLSSVQKSYAATDSAGIPLDIKLINLFNYSGGFFIEVGAYDGITFSNTKLLEEDYGWTGILIEPSEVLFEQLQANRANSLCFCCALGSFEENHTYVVGDFDGHPMASINGTRLSRNANQRVLVRSLQSILDEVGIHHINLFSLDVEGHELEILKGIDFDKSAFDFILVEVYDYQKNDIFSYLFSKGYDLFDSITNYNHVSNPGWDGSHNDYLFIRRGMNPLQ